MIRFPRVLAGSALAAVLWTAVVAPLLPSSGGGLMPCCEGGSPCETALRASGCCRIDAAPVRAVGLAAAVTRNPGSFKAFLPPAPALSAFGIMSPILVRMVAMPAADSPPGIMGIPLYLLNAALLR